MNHSTTPTANPALNATTKIARECTNSRHQMLFNSMPSRLPRNAHYLLPGIESHDADANSVSAYELSSTLNIRELKISWAISRFKHRVGGVDKYMGAVYLPRKCTVGTCDSSGRASQQNHMLRS